MAIADLRVELKIKVRIYGGVCPHRWKKCVCVCEREVFYDRRGRARASSGCKHQLPQLSRCPPPLHKTNYQSRKNIKTGDRWVRFVSKSKTSICNLPVAEVKPEPTCAVQSIPSQQSCQMRTLKLNVSPASDSHFSHHQ